MHTEEMTIEQQNEMIARFMEVERDVNTWRHPYGATVYLMGGYWLPAKKLKYHSSWEWLMPVVEKISKTKMQQYESHQDTHWPRTFGMPAEDGSVMVRFNCAPVWSAPTLIEATYLAVIDFIKWYTAYIEKQPTTQNQGV